MLKKVIHIIFVTSIVVFVVSLVIFLSVESAKTDFTESQTYDFLTPIWNQLKGIDTTITTLTMIASGTSIVLTAWGRKRFR